MTWSEDLTEDERALVAETINRMWDENEAELLRSLAPMDIPEDVARDYIRDQALVFQIRNEKNQEDDLVLDQHDVELLVEDEIVGWFEYEPSLDRWHWQSIDCLLASQLRPRKC